MTTPSRCRYAGHRSPAEIISHAIWLHLRFPLKVRLVEAMLAARGIIASHKSLR
jgi:putative transposase